MGSSPEDARHSLTGRQLGAYQVRSLLGRGGMGEVYRAHDTKLDRDVAIKVLPSSVADDPGRLARFDVEARLLATLNCPHIGAIYGIEDVGGVRALVLELVEGETVADRVRRGPVPVSEALAIAGQLADALDAAHERGIVHRDLKPANIKVTPDGIVKVLDFGLAKIVAPNEADSPDTQSPTVAVAGTRQGTILGTTAYMSPEQTRGRPLDKRTDIWSFGCVLHEMLTGRAPFSGESDPDVMAAILSREPEWSALPPDTPAGVRRLLERCLEKDPKRRLRDMGDARLELESLKGDLLNPVGEASGVTSPKVSSRWLTLAVALLALTLAVSAGALLLREEPRGEDQPLRRFSMDLGMVRPVISPDGRHLAYRADGRLWIRDIGSETPREIPGGVAAGGFNSDAAYYLTWSPDSRDLVFTAENELRRVTVAGGSTTTVCTLPPGRTSGRRIAGMAWSSDGDTIVFSRYGSGIYEVPARGGSPTLLWEEDHADDVLPFDTAQGRAVVFAESVAEGHDLIVRTPDGQRRLIGHLDTAWPELVYSPSGHILFRQNPVESPSIWALPFSSETLTAAGDAFVIERTGQGMSLSSDGTLVYLDTGRIQGQRLVWRDRAGVIVERADQSHEAIETLSLSPDGQRAIITARDGQLRMWMYDVERFLRTRFDIGDDAESARVMTAFFSRTGEDVIYTLITSSSETAVFAKPVDGYGQARVVTSPDGFKVAVDQSTEGRYLAYVVLARGMAGPGPTSLWVTRNDGSGGATESFNFSQNSAGEGSIALSPNGRFAAYTSTLSGRPEIYVRPFPEGRGRTQVSLNGGDAPYWARDGEELFFREGNTLMSASVTTGDTFSAGPPEPLFDHPTLRIGPGPGARYAVSLDGQRFLTVESERDRQTPVVRFVQNWRSEFERGTRSE